MNKSVADLLATAQKLHHSEALEREPVILGTEQLGELLKARPDLKVVDEYNQLLEELFRIENPSLTPYRADYYQQLADFQAEHYAGKPAADAGLWIYYSWRGCIVHDLPTNLHNRVRTARNRNLISDAEQEKLRHATIGVAGLSVGSNVVAALAMSGQYRQLKIADADILSLSNLNRLRAGLSDIGVPKTTLAARGIYELDPMADVAIFSEGLTDDNLEKFLENLDIVVDEIDDVSMKVKLRLAARERHLPVVMVTDTSNSCILDIERYDLKPDQEIFHGRLSGTEIDMLLRPDADRAGWVKLIAKIIGVEHMQPRLLECLPEIGKTLSSPPQLGGAAMIAGSVGAYTARMIILGEPINAGKLPYPIEAVLLKDYEKIEAKKRALLQKMMAG